MTAQLATGHGHAERRDHAPTIDRACPRPASRRASADRPAPRPEDYFFSRLDLSPEQTLNFLAPLPPTLELIPDPMYKALENIVELIVDGEYEDLARASPARSCSSRGPAPPRRGRLARGARRCRRASTTASRRSRKLRRARRRRAGRYFLDLWTEDGPARLHVEGEMALTADGRFLVSINDILP